MYLKKLQAKNYKDGSIKTVNKLINKAMNKSNCLLVSQSHWEPAIDQIPGKKYRLYDGSHCLQAYNETDQFIIENNIDLLLGQSIKINGLTLIRVH